MGKVTKTIGYPIGNPTEPELLAVGANEDVRTSTPIPTNDREPEHGPPGNEMGDYRPGQTPPYEISSESEASEDEAEEPQTEEEHEEEDKDTPGPAPPAPWLSKSGPITPEDIVEPKRSEEAKDRKIHKEESKKAKESVEPYESTPRRKRELEPNPSEKKGKGSDPQLLFIQQQEIIDKIKLNKTLSDTDNRTLLLSLHTQVATLTGAVDNATKTVDKLNTKVRAVHGFTSGLEETFLRSLAELKELGINAWRSQGRNRASIDSNNELIKETNKTIEAWKAAISAGAGVHPGITKIQEPNWMHPHSGATGGAMITPIHPNFAGVPSGAPAHTGFGGYGYQMEPQQLYQPPTRCDFCFAGHAPEKCRAFPKWHIRRRLMIDRKACFWCLKPGTSPEGQIHEDCPSKHSCELCLISYPHPSEAHRRHHHVALCERVKPMPAEPTREAAAPPPKKAKPSTKKDPSSKSTHKKRQ